MTVVDVIRQYLKIRTDISDDQLWKEIQAIASELGYQDLTILTEAENRMIAEEVDKNVSGLATVENNGQLTAAEETKGKKNKKNTPAPPSDSQQAQTLKPAVIGLRNAIESEVSGLSNAFDQEFTKNERKAAQKITERAKQFAPNVVNYVAEELEGYKADSEVFHGQITGIIQEAFGGFLDN